MRKKVCNRWMTLNIWLSINIIYHSLLKVWSNVSGLHCFHNYLWPWKVLQFQYVSWKYRSRTLCNSCVNSGGTTPGSARSNDLAGRSTALPENTMPDFDSKGDKLLAFAKFVSKYDESFYELNRLIGIAVTLLVTSVKAEWSFSSLKLIKTHLRTTMLDDRLSDIAMLSVHSQRANALD